MSPPVELASQPRASVQALAKVLLHDHLDGSLRPGTLLDLCRQKGLSVPADHEPALQAWFRANAMAGSLERYLQGFALTVAAMASLPALQRVAREAAEDAAAEGCVLAEFRIAPLLFEPHGLQPQACVEALLQGLSEGPIPCGLIICGMRQHSPEDVMRSAELALRYRFNASDANGHTTGVVGFDLAGPELGYPATLHAKALHRVREGGLPLTLHAGEADGAERVLEAVRLGARRIGHGVRIADWLKSPRAIEDIQALKQADIHFEVCPTSNVHTGAAPDIAHHPIRAMWDAGLSLSYQTDNHLISCVDMNAEGLHLIEQAHFTVSDLQRMQTLALQASFMPQALKTQAKKLLADPPAPLRN